MIDPDKFISAYIDDALSISALCTDLGLSRDDAKLFTYIFVKSSNHPLGLDYFSDEREEEVAALEIMLGLRQFASGLGLTKENYQTVGALQNFGSAVADGVYELDRGARESLAVESYLRSELLRRLRFHKDVEYRKAKLALFSGAILPRMKEYNRKKVFEVFERQRNEPERVVLNFRDSLN